MINIGSIWVQNVGVSYEEFPILKAYCSVVVVVTDTHVFFDHNNMYFKESIDDFLVKYKRL
jgi:hypothetical protein